MLSTFHEYMGEQPIADITTSALRRYIVALRESDYAPDSVYAYIKALHALFRWAADEYGIVNPMRHIAYPKQPNAKMPRRARDEDIIRMLQSCGDDPQGRRDRAIIGFLTDTGCRAGGLVGLTMDRLDVEQRRAFVMEKGERTRPVFFSVETAEFLTDWIAVRHEAAPAAVFYNLRTRRQLTSNGLLEILRRLGRTAGVTGPVNPHAFRHRFGINFMLAGGDSGVLQQMMGHRDIETTVSRYGKFGEQELATAHNRRVKSLFKKPKSE
jgi:integrase/recombinase XerD